MKKLFLASALCVAALSSCNDDTDPVAGQVESIPMEVQAFIDGGNNESRVGWTGDKTTWQSGDAMGLFVYKGTWGTTYNSVGPNVKSTYTTKWAQTPAVNMTADKAQVWAYYPYNEKAGDGKKVPVDLTTDYLYGTNGSASVSTANPNVKIGMKHALTQFVLRMKKSPEYKDKGILTEIKLVSTQAELGKTGTMDIQNNGLITPISPATAIAYQSLQETFPSADTPVDYAALLFPMTSTANLTLHVTIDRVPYTYKIPNVKWEAGKKNVYSVVLKSNGIVIGGETGKDITIESWGPGVNADVTLKPVQ